jgi:quinol-cytochrome oxidoreductase complex cytochrome b subunit
MFVRLRQWAAQFLQDLRASSDPSLLGIARFFGLLYGPIDRRVRIDEAWRKALRYRLAPHVGWRHALGGITYLLLMLQVVTGVLLALYYRPSAQEAYPSLQHIVSQVPFGWLVRDVHVWSASLLVIVLLAHMARVFFAAAYKPPRETNWIIGILLLVVVVAFGVSGSLLPWDQWAYWTATESLEALPHIPLLGPVVADLLRGDQLVTGATLGRYFSLHVIVLPWLLFALVGLHFSLVRRHGVAPPVRGAAPTGRGVPFYPTQLMRILMAAAVTVALVVTCAILWPRAVGAPADPATVPSELVSTWVVTDVARAFVHYGGLIGVVGFALLFAALALLPLFDRDPERHRRMALALGIAFFAATVAAWGVGRTLQSHGPRIERPQEALPQVPFGAEGPDTTAAGVPSPPPDSAGPGGGA